MKFLFLILGVRILSVFVIRTWYVPDEYWQSLEVAHRLAFGYGYLTWEWHEGIRSYVYPLIIAALYKILHILRLDTVFCLTVLPRILQAVFTGVAEYSLYRWSGYRKWFLFVVLSSWFVFYTGSRTLLNSVEYALTAIAITQYPWHKHEEKYNFLWTICLGTIMRPTFIIPWIPLCIYHLYNCKHRFLEVVSKRYLPIGLLTILFSVSVDSLASGAILCTHWNFLKLNVLQDIGHFYGSHPWHWYISVGLPTIMGINFIPFTFATSSIIKNKFIYRVPSLMLMSIAFSIGIYSLISHKEFRFLLSILPMALVIVSFYIAQISSYKWIPRYVLYGVILTIGVCNMIPIYYLGWVHQSGTTMVMPELYNVIKNYSSAPNVLFLMPCHSTPYYSHIHQNITMRFLTCEPKDKYNGIADEAAIFYDDPHRWFIMNNFGTNLNNECSNISRTREPKLESYFPTHLILFEKLKENIPATVLENYREVANIFHTNFPDDRISEFISILELKEDNNL